MLSGITSRNNRSSYFYKTTQQCILEYWFSGKDKECWCHILIWFHLLLCTTLLYGLRCKKYFISLFLNACLAHESWTPTLQRLEIRIKVFIYWLIDFQEFWEEEKRVQEDSKKKKEIEDEWTFSELSVELKQRERQWPLHCFLSFFFLGAQGLFILYSSEPPQQFQPVVCDYTKKKDFVQCCICYEPTWCGCYFVILLCVYFVWTAAQGKNIRSLSPMPTSKSPQKVGIILWDLVLW